MAGGVMRAPETERLLAEVRRVVAEARAGGVSVQACIFDATVAAVDGGTRSWPSAEARGIAVAACRAVEPPSVAELRLPSKPPSLVQRLRALARRMV
ncbi:hypothetical protein ABTY20_18835 [Streptomyces sp. NPDC126497]|uniref:hypothetical protein n=1 Tax=Streptomyces sp. NPDC126497 TaxID=3155313 RepID=UPI00331E62FA